MKTNKYISLEEREPKKTFSVPDNYFDEFAARFETQIKQTTTPRKKLIRPWMYMAAMVVVVLTIGQLIRSTYEPSSDQLDENYELYVLSQVDEASIMDYYVDEQKK